MEGESAGGIEQVEAWRKWTRCCPRKAQSVSGAAEKAGSHEEKRGRGSADVDCSEISRLAFAIAPINANCTVAGPSTAMVLENKAQRAFSALSGSICLSCRASQSALPRPGFLNTAAPQSFFSTTARRAADDPYRASSLASTLGMGRRPTSNISASDLLGKNFGPELKPGEASIMEEPEPHHLHILSSKHNTHLTLTRPDRNPIISVAAGNIGFRKAGRSTYDAAYQLAAFVLSNIQERGLLLEIKRLELVFRGFGDGREAVRKAIMGTEGMMIRNRIVRVTDATRLKFGGTRSRKPRRLG